MRNHTDLRQECFLFELPYDARLGPGLVQHIKDDPNATRDPGWSDFDLQRWLGREMPDEWTSLDMSGTEGSMCSSTLMFSAAELSSGNPLKFVSKAWPAVFEQQLRDYAWPRRLLHYRPVAWLREHLLGFLGREVAPTVRRTVVKAIRIAPKQSDFSGEWQFDQLRIAHRHLSDYLAAAASVHGDPELRPVTLQDLPAMVIGFGFDIPRDGGEPALIERRTYLVHERIPDRPRQPIGSAEAEVAMWVSAAADNPMLAVMRFLTSAHQAAYRGEFTHAVVDAGTSVEMLMSTALRIAAPEHGYTDRKLQKALKKPFKRRIVDHCAPLFGYSKDLDKSSDALGTWWQIGYGLRNRIVHAGHRPSEDDALRAAQAADSLFRDLGARLMADPKVEPKLPQIPEDLRREAQAERSAIQSLYGPHA